MQQKEKKDKKILPVITQYHQAVPNLKNILMSKWHLIQNQPLPKEICKEPPITLRTKEVIRSIQTYTRLIQTLEAKNTHLRTTGVVQACHNFLISEKRITKQLNV